ncbi:high frequency lysogenization protein HflD [Halorhodospira neutriphila]|uniref:High frequency lysogenization protein HflD homolog n=1 Tax=Halorhodospira neutriphila TaxID=168379 RepID=A0ABS1E5M2_9GAMM|nr:high frequency lysogenization protein HflD [Halorhodospira neutriphila]MBK1726397.1 lysogenization regulator HflD [Halorhodospira neutriphila]
MSAEKSHDEQALALAVILQAVQGVHEIAHHGGTEAELYHPLVEGLLGEYQGSVAELYGGERLGPGLRRTIEQLEQPRDAETTRYVAAILHLERRLMKRGELLERVRRGLEEAQRQAEYFGSAAHTNVLHRLGDLYSQSISEMGPRLMVRGEQQYLEDERNAALIRTLLLCAIRGASLWRDQGGGRLTLLLHRGRIAAAGRGLLDALPEQA